MNRDRLLAAALPMVAILSLILILGPTLLAAASAGTLGHDFRAYDLAVRRVLAGGSLYDVSLDFMGPAGLFFYPPTFVLLAAPLAILDPTSAISAWTGVLVASFALGVALLPVDRRTRWLILLLGGLSWPLVYAIKLGQVGPILLLMFVIGWRWMDRPWRLGAATALGTAIKIQPALIFAWALVTGRRRAAVAGLAVLGVLALVATLVAGPGSWADQITLLARVNRPIDTPHNMTLGGLAFEAGMGEGIAWAIQLTSWAFMILLAIVALVRCTPVASYLVVVVVSQLASPVLWDHYALVLLIPVAWLVSRGRSWTMAIPLATSALLVGVIPPIAYPLAYWVTLLAVVREGWAHP